MMRRTYPGAQPDRTGGDDAATVPCAGRWFVYDVLVDQASGPVFRSALAEARSICGGCPIQTGCLSRALDEEEPWAQAVVGTKRARRVPTPHAQKRPHVSEMMRAKHARANTERADALRRLAAEGATRADAVAELGITASALYQWCLAHGHKAAWNALRQEVAA